MAGDAEPALHEVVVAASSLLDPAALADLTVRHIRRLVQADGAWLTWWDADYSVLVPLAVDDERIGRPEPVCHRGQGLAGAAFDTGETVRVDDYAGEVDHPLPWSQMVSGVGVPLVAGERPAGALTVQSYTPRTFTDREVGLLERAAEQVGPALQTMGLLALAGRRTAEAEAFGALMRTGSRVVEDEAVATLICEYAVRLLGADVAGVALRDPLGTASAWRGVVGATTEEWREHRYGAHHPAAATLFGGEVRVVDGPDGGRFDSEIFPFFAAESVRRGIAVPLVDEGRSLGALSVGWRFRPELPKAQVAFAEALAGFAATLVTRAQATSQRDALVANAPVVLAAMDTDGAITICEGAAAQAVGLGPELVGRSAADVLAEAPELAEGLGAVLHGGDARRLQVEFRGRTFDAHLLSPEAGSYLVATDITEAEAARAELQHQAVTDALTSLPNRAEAMRRTGEALAAGPLVTICGDIRAFDGVNATLGYDAADELLRELGARLAVDLADAVVVGRVGGDEFVVVLEGDDPVAAVERVRASLEAPVAGTQVDARFGIALGVPGDDAATFLRRADVALQLARRSTDVAIVYEADIAADRALDHQLARDLHTALGAGALDVAYQPIVALPDRRTCHCEALARWTHPEHGPIGPDRFVGLAERSGRIGLLTRLVLDRALAEIPAALGLPVSVNVSPLDLADPGFADVVADRLATHGVAADRLILELTESEELARGRETLVALAAMGVTVAIDDFGRGWSSLELLKRLPARQLKLDRAFVSELADDVTNQAIVRAAVSIAAAFGMQVIAEGVEDDATLAAVEQLGCDTVQGFLLARPMSAAALRDWLG